jgi:hypothetical protein
LDELRNQASPSPYEVRWALANALTVAGDASMRDEIETLLSDDRFKDVRNVLKLVLKKQKSG